MRFAPLIGLAVVLLLTAATWAQRTYNLNETWEATEHAITDASLRIRLGTRPVHLGEEAIIIGIDDQTMATARELYERRAGSAELIDRLYQLGAKAVALDMIYSEPERLLPEDLTRRVVRATETADESTSPELRALLDEIVAETKGDERLAEAIKGPSGERRTTMLAFHLGNRGATGVDDRSLSRGTFGQVVSGEHLPGRSERALASLPTLNRAARRLGAISNRQDGQGTMRTVPLVLRARNSASEGTGDRYFVPFGVQLAAMAMGVNRGLIVYRGDIDAVELGDLRIPADRGSLWVNWRGARAFPEISAKRVMDPAEEEAMRAAIAGKIAVFAMTHVAQDEEITPLGRQPGVQTHLTVMDNILRGDFMRRASIRTDAGFTFGLGLLTVGLFLLPGLRAHHVIGTGALFVIAVAVPHYLYSEHAYWLGSVGAKLVVVLAALACMATAWLQEGAESRALRGAFARYVSDDLLKVIADDPTLVSLQGQRRELSILFSDIRDFTSHSERMDPLELVAFLNEYLTPMTRAVLDNRGMVDKFIGDAVMALFGAPVPDEHHAVQSCLAALEMHVALESIKPIAAGHGIDLAIGIGVNSGEVALGNLGSGDRFEYTVLGDAVNLAARLEGLTKNYGVFCLLGSRTATQLPPSFGLRTIDLVRVKGKDEPVEIFELTGDDRITIARYTEIDAWNDGIRHWRAGDFPRARHAFEQFQAANPGDPTVALYLDRLEARPEAPEGWDGVFTHTKK